MRLGRRTTHFVTSDSIVSTYLFQIGFKMNELINFLGKLYGNVDSVDERHRHRYEINPQYIEEYERAGVKFVGKSDDDERVEILEPENHRYFVAVQYYPEYVSRPFKPSVPYLGLIWV